MDAPLRFGRRNALYAVAAGFKFQTPVYAVAGHFSDNFLVAAVLAFAGAHDFNAPAAGFGIAAVHTEQVASEQRGFVAAGARSHFDERITLVIRIFWQQQHLQLLFQLFAFVFRFAQFILRHFAHFRIVEHHLRGFDVILNLLPVGKAARHVA